MPDRPQWRLLVTAEHGGNHVPDPYRPLFDAHRDLLESHRGWDPGSLPLATVLAGKLGARLVAATVTRLLVDLNRSPRHRRVFSEVTRSLPTPERRQLLEGFHRPHRETVGAWIAHAVADGHRVLHLGVHTFTPALNGSVRRPDVALLYDPARRTERALAGQWVQGLKAELPGRVIGRNDPYRGSADGLTTSLRRRFPASRYLGIEIEVNQRHLTGANDFPAWVADGLLHSLTSSLNGKRSDAS